MTGTARDAIDVAANVVGQTENPPGSNRCHITDELDATFPRVPLANGGTSTRGGTSWCSSANLWWLWRSGYPVDPRGCLVVNGVDIWCFYTPADVNAWKRAGRWLDWREKPPVGALVFFDWQGTHGTTSLTDHTGIVVDVATDGQLTTIEGNTSPGGFVSNGGGVYLFGPGQRSPARPLSTVVGYGLPLYAPDVPLAPGDDDPMLYVTNSEPRDFGGRPFPPGAIIYAIDPYGKLRNVKPAEWNAAKAKGANPVPCTNAELDYQAAS